MKRRGWLMAFYFRWKTLTGGTSCWRNSTLTRLSASFIYLYFEIILKIYVMTLEIKLFFLSNINFISDFFPLIFWSSRLILKTFLCKDDISFRRRCHKLEMLSGSRARPWISEGGYQGPALCILPITANLCCESLIQDLDSCPVPFNELRFSVLKILWVIDLELLHPYNSNARYLRKV